MIQSTAEPPTTRGAQLVQTMIRHFGHKIDTEISDSHGLMHLEPGDARAETTAAGLRLTVAAPDPEAVGKLCDVIACHLLRFAQRDDPQLLAWTPVA